MEGIAIRAPPRIRVSNPGLFSPRSTRNLIARDRILGIQMIGRGKPNPSPLRCASAEKVSKDSNATITSNSDDITSSTADNGWDTGEERGEHPTNILEKIIWDKDVEVQQIKERKPLSVLKKALEEAPPARDFIGALKASYNWTGMPALIAEVKKASPSKGVLREDFDPVTCLSVLTDEKYFQGSFENLEAIRKAGVKCPLLCKEFIIDAWQIYYARCKGADAILLIAAVLPDLDIKYLTKICGMLGLAALVEVHDEREMDRVLGIDGIQLIGINNRNLETFEVDISNTKRLLEGERGRIIAERDIIVVGESGLFTPEDVSYVQNAGVKAVLVGESLIKQEDPGKAIAGLFGKDISSSV
uniref:indole-3-glycerol-phosphate synthase n=1 Tax=Ananas comosus var. bracteatus TaxID=296719 RepID=A0A6V7P3V3_ANACO|nr:unnamed protein product [Ananas comosus var. bracteatus]